MTVIDEAHWQLAAHWGAAGFVAALDGPIHWIDFGGPDDATPMVFVHGLGGSHLNWTLIGPALAAGRHVYALDLHGFGLTPGDRSNSSIQANTRLVDIFLRQQVGRPVILVGNSMGGLISILQAAAHSDTVERLILIDPALPLPPRLPDPGVAATFIVYAVPGVGEATLRTMQARLSAGELVTRIAKLCFADTSRADKDMFGISAELIRIRREVPDQEAAFLAAARSLMRCLLLPRSFEKKMASINVPVLLIHGEADRLVPIAAARRAAKAHPAWTTHFLPGVGHTPQLEVPRDSVEIIDTWLRAH